MSARWKHQLRFGLLWGTVMAILMTTFYAWENENWNLFLTWNFLLRLAIFNAVGVFIVGYFSWKDTEKALAKNNRET
jgi:hypothetical protein